LKLDIPIKIDQFQIDARFIKWLIPYIRYEVLKNINNRQLLEIDRYVEESQLLENYKIGNIQFNSKRILLMSINNLVFHKGKDFYTIEINNIAYPGYAITLKNICKLVNFGNMDIKGYPIITNAFNHITDNLKRYIVQYYR
jgi:hypothetical protein